MPYSVNYQSYTKKNERNEDMKLIKKTHVKQCLQITLVSVGSWIKRPRSNINTNWTFEINPSWCSKCSQLVGRVSRKNMVHKWSTVSMHIVSLVDVRSICCCPDITTGFFLYVHFHFNAICTVHSTFGLDERWFFSLYFFLMT